jgi:hypothetical protein
MSDLRRRLDRTYKPSVAAWKRPVLLLLSLIIGVGCGAAAWALIHHQQESGGVWLIIGLFAILSVAGMIAALFGDDWWVALVLGDL